MTLPIVAATATMWLFVGLTIGRETKPWIGICARYSPALVYLLNWSAFCRYHVDDAGISYAYAFHLSQGLGLRAFPSAPAIEGFSNPSWTFLLAALAAAGVDLESASKVLQLLFGLLTLSLVRRLVQEADFGPLEANAAAALTATSAPFVLWSSAGLENALLAALLAAGVLFLLRGRTLAFVVIAGAVALTRPEGILLSLALLTSMWMLHPGRRSRIVRITLLALLPFLGYEAFRLAYFGDFVPNTFHAKVDNWGLGSRVMAGARYLFSTLSFAGLVSALVAALGAASSRAGRRLAAATIPTLGAGTLFVLYSGGDWMAHGRFVSHLLPLAAALFTAGTSSLFESLSSRHGRLSSIARPASWLLFLALSLSQLPALETAKRVPTVPLAEIQADREQLEAISRTWCDQDLLAVASPDIGGLLWPPGGPTVIDLAGLIDAQASRRLDPSYWIDRFRTERPQFVIVHGPWTAMTRLKDSDLGEIGYRRHCRATPTAETADPLERLFPFTVYRRQDCDRPPTPDGIVATELLCE